MKGISFFTFLTILHESQTLCDPGMCGPGEALDGNGKCQPCPERHYQYMQNHSCISCFLCSVPHSDQIVIKPCTRTTNTQIGCPPGKFIDSPPHEIYCEPCRHCAEDEDEIAPCQGRENTKCAARTTQSPVTTTTLIPPTLESASTKIISSKSVDVDKITTMEKQPDNPRYKEKDVDGAKEDENNGGEDNTRVKVVAVIIAVLGICLIVCFLEGRKEASRKDRSPDLNTSV